MEAPNILRRLPTTSITFALFAVKFLTRTLRTGTGKAAVVGIFVLESPKRREGNRFAKTAVPSNPTPSLIASLRGMGDAKIREMRSNVFSSDMSSVLSLRLQAASTNSFHKSSFCQREREAPS